MKLHKVERLSICHNSFNKEIWNNEVYAIRQKMTMMCILWDVCGCYTLQVAIANKSWNVKWKGRDSWLYLGWKLKANKERKEKWLWQVEFN